MRFVSFVGFLALFTLACTGLPQHDSAVTKKGDREYTFNTYIGESKKTVLEIPDSVESKNEAGETIVSYDFKYEEITTFKVKAVFSNDKVSAIVAGAPLKDQTQFGVTFTRATCDQFSPKHKKVVEYGDLKTGGYSGRLLDQINKANVSIGCVSSDKNFVSVTMSKDVLAVVIDSKESSYRKFLESQSKDLVEFDWTGPLTGEDIVVGDFSYVITSVDAASNVGGSMFAKKATSGTVFVAVRYTIENKTGVTDSVMASDLLLVDSKGREFRSAGDVTEGLAYSEKISTTFVQLQPGIKKKQVVGFEVPVDSLGRINLVIPEKGMFNSGKVVLPFVLVK